jgi:hypothetical protein
MLPWSRYFTWTIPSRRQTLASVKAKGSKGTRDPGQRREKPGISCGRVDGRGRELLLGWKLCGLSVLELVDGS